MPNWTLGFYFPSVLPLKTHTNLSGQIQKKSEDEGQVTSEGHVEDRIMCFPEQETHKNLFFNVLTTSGKDYISRSPLT